MDRPRTHLRSTWWLGALWSVMVVATLTGAAVAQAPVTAPAPGEPWTVVAIGDSFMEGIGVVRRSDAMPHVYGRLLAQAVGAPVEVINHGTGQLHTVADWTVEVSASASLSAHLMDADIVLVWLGFHDVLRHLGSTPWPDRCARSWRPWSSAHPRTGRRSSRRSPRPLRRTRILVSELGIPLYLFDRFGSHPDWPEIRRSAYLDWRVVMVETAERYGARVVPTFEAINGPDGDAFVGPESVRPDGLHADEVAHRLVAELFRAHDGIGPGD